MASFSIHQCHQPVSNLCKDLIATFTHRGGFGEFENSFIYISAVIFAVIL